MKHEAYGYEPPRVAMCTCGATFRAQGLQAINDLIEQHTAEGTEGVDHAVWIDSQLLDDKERH